MVFDTNVISYALMGVDEYREAASESLQRADTIEVPDSFFAEFPNVLWQWVEHEGAEEALARDIWLDARELVHVSGTSRELGESALTLSIEHSHPVYDTIFVALAIERDTRVLTFDSGLLSTFPEHCVAPDEFVE